MVTYSKPTAVLLEERVWKELSPQIFERFAADIISCIFPDSKIDLTSPINDGGYDLVVIDDSKVFSAVGYGEAKHTKQNSLADYARSVVAALKSIDCKLLILVTSAKINLNSYAEAYTVLKDNGTDFRVIHRATLTSLLSSFPELIDKYYIGHFIDKHELNYTKYFDNKFSDISTHYAFTIISNHHDSNPKTRAIYMANPESEGRQKIKKNEKLRLAVLIENNTNKSKDIVVKIQQTAMWHSHTGAKRTQHLTPFGSAYCEYILGLNADRGASLPNIELYRNSDSSGPILTIDAGDFTIIPHYTPPYQGKNAHFNKRELIHFVSERTTSNNNSIVFITGPAGGGKTRLFDEAKKELSSSHNIEYFRCNIERGKSLKPLRNITKQIMTNLCSAPQKSLDGEWSAGQIADLLSLPLLETCCILVEDLHHADDETFSCLIKLIENLRQADNGSPVILVFTGRNDDTFYNKGFDKLKIYLSGLSKTNKENDIAQYKEFKLQEMTELDMRALITAIFTNGISEAAIEKLLPLCQNRPFNLFQILEYLTEQSIAELHQQNGYSIKKPEVFYSKDGFPSTLIDVFHERLRSLVQFDPEGVVILAALAFWGVEIPHETVKSIIEETDSEKILHELTARNYITSKDEHTYQITHENIIHFVFELAHKSEFRNSISKAARTLLEVSEDEELHSLQLSKLYHYAETKHYRNKLLSLVLDEMGARDATDVSQKNNLISSYSIFKYGEMLFDQLVKTDNMYINELFDLLYLKAFVSKFTQNYYSTIHSVKESLYKMEEILRSEGVAKTKEHKFKLARLNQIVGHVAQNATDIKISHAHITKVVNFLGNVHSVDPTGELLDLRFEAADRGRKNFLYIGDLDSAEDNTENIREIVELKNDPYLRAIAGIGRAEVYFVQNPVKAFSLWHENNADVEAYAEDRIKLTAALVMHQEEIVLQKANPDELYFSLKELLEIAQEKRFVGPLPKIHLLKGTYDLLKGDAPEAIKSFDDSYNEAEKYGYGVFLWLSMNNKALAQQVLGDMEGAYHSYRTAWGHAKKQGFYKYPVVNSPRPLFFQNALVYNYLLFSKLNDYPNVRFEILSTLGINDTSDLYDNYLERPADPLFKFGDFGYYMTFI
ncbi:MULTISPECIES: AAA family ATPase [unclassified Maridesulfovibrio]|uniref:AAA family ATPase n=1 Tax=unclassified Maridesulfovibrio TaxID=2794999 RepID=UPI003B3D71D3